MSQVVDKNGGPAVPAAAESSASRIAAIRKFLDQDVRPYIQADGGDIELVTVDGNKVLVKLMGACVACPSAIQTLRQGVEQRLQAKVSPELMVEQQD
jgi:NifU-like protein